MECEEGNQPLRKIVNHNRYVNLAPNVNTVKPDGAVKPRIVHASSKLCRGSFRLSPLH